MFVSNLPLPIFQFISEFLLYKSEICWKGIDQNPKMCLLEYLVTINSFNKQFAINYAKQVINTYKNIKHIGWFINHPINTDYLKIHRCIHLNDEEPIKYIINYINVLFIVSYICVHSGYTSLILSLVNPLTKFTQGYGINI